MLSPEDHCFPSKALQSQWRGGVGKARGPPAKRQREEGVGVARVGKQNWEGWQIRLVKAGGERKVPRLQKLMAGEALLPWVTPGSV